MVTYDNSHLAERTIGMAEIEKRPWRFTIEFDEEADEAFPASLVDYNNTTSGMAATTVQAAVDELFTSVSEGKSLIAAAVTDKGVETAATDSFATMAEKIGQIELGGELKSTQHQPEKAQAMAQSMLW